MNYGKVLASAQLALCVAASIGYASAGDWRKCLYWAFAAGISAVVTF